MAADCFVVKSLLGSLIWLLLSTYSFAQDPLTHLGLRATKGAAAGYVEDKACATCHKELYDSYQHVGMAKSFAKPDHAEVIEDFGKEFFHKASQRYYKILKKDGQLVFQRYNRDAKGNPINHFEEVIDWVMGSGNRARSYLYQTEAGELFTLPLGWYSEEKTWGMSPGFEDGNHLGVKRQVKRQCMFCHNAYPEVASGSDAHWEKHLFPKELPQGTGCQRCHGPGGNHIRAVMSGAGIEAVRKNIVNPAKLPAKQRDSVCFQCHMLPAVTMIGSRKFDRADYSFRPGEVLSDYILHTETEVEGVKKEDFFEINHHGYRFWSSDCYQKSEGKLACITCHNPHTKPDSKTFRAKVSSVCQGCHAQPETMHSFAVTQADDCTACHMPTRRTRDVVLTTMTDHRIARGPFDKKALVAPIKKEFLPVVGLNLLPFGSLPSKDEGEIYRIITSIRTMSQPASISALENILKRTGYQHMTPELELVRAKARIKDYQGTVQSALAFVKKYPQMQLGHELLGLARIGQGKSREARISLEKSIEIDPTPTAFYNLGIATFRLRDFEASMQAFEKAISMRPNLYAAWLYKGRLLVRKGQLAQAEQAFKRSLSIEPSYAAAYRDLVILLRRLEKNAEAQNYLEVGKQLAAKKERLADL